MGCREDLFRHIVRSWPTNTRQGSIYHIIRYFVSSANFCPSCLLASFTMPQLLMRLQELKDQHGAIATMLGRVSAAVDLCESSGSNILWTSGKMSKESLGELLNKWEPLYGIRTELAAFLKQVLKPTRDDIPELSPLMKKNDDILQKLFQYRLPSEEPDTLTSGRSQPKLQKLPAPNSPSKGAPKALKPPSKRLGAPEASNPPSKRLRAPTERYRASKTLNLPSADKQAHPTVNPPSKSPNPHSEDEPHGFRPINFIMVNPPSVNPPPPRLDAQSKAVRHASAFKHRHLSLGSILTTIPKRPK